MSRQEQASDRAENPETLTTSPQSPTPDLHSGSTFDSFLDEEGIRGEVEAFVRVRNCLRAAEAYCLEKHEYLKFLTDAMYDPRVQDRADWAHRIDVKFQDLCAAVAALKRPAGG